MYPSHFVCFCFQHTGIIFALQGCRTAKKQGRLTSQQAAPTWDKYPIIGCQQGGTGYRLPPARSAPDFGVYHPYPQRKRALFHAPAAQAD